MPSTASPSQAAQDKGASAFHAKDRGPPGSLRQVTAKRRMAKGQAGSFPMKGLDTHPPTGRGTPLDLGTIVLLHVAQGLKQAWNLGC